MMANKPSDTGSDCLLTVWYFMMQRWTLIVVVSLAVQTLLIYNSYTLLQFRCSSNEVSKLKQALKRVSSELEEMRREHHRLATVVERSPWLINEPTSQRVHSRVVLSYETGPALEYEKLRRRAYSCTRELWYFVRDQLERALGEDFEGQKRVMAAVRQEVADRKRWLLTLQEQLPLADGREEWRRQEAYRVSDLVQRRLNYLQNPRNCRKAKKLVCPYEWKCGFGCDIHYLASCLIQAYATERVLVLRNDTWRYSGEEKHRGWDHVFLPLSHTCTDYYDENYTVPGAAVSKAQVLYFPTTLYRKYVQRAVPIHYIPQDLAQRIVRFSSDPSSWWVGQMLKYILRPQSDIKTAIDDAVEDTNITTPIVGVHVRRTDKLIKEADYFPLEEYMSKVEDYYEQLEQTTAVDVRRVYLATDDANVLKEAVVKYPQYKFYSNYSRALQAAPATRYSMQALTGLLADINMLAMCDYVVCTLSSNIARTVSELMHTNHVDVSNRFISLDITNFYYRAEPLLRVAVMRNADIAFDVDDVIESYSWNYTSYGTVLRTNITGRIPWYKTQEQLVLYPFPEYEHVPLSTDQVNDYREMYYD